MIYKIPTETIQSPNYKKVLSGWVGDKQANEIISKDSKELPYWFDSGICQSIVNEVAILDYKDKELEDWSKEWMPAIEIARQEAFK